MAQDGLFSGWRFELAQFGEMVGDASRAAMLLSLMDGCERPASELAAVAGVTPATASVHLKKLLDGGMLTVGQQGRHRYYRIADEAIGHALESVALRRSVRAPPLTPLQTALKHARTCYKHLAGELGVALFDALEKRRWLRLDRGEIHLTHKGLDELQLPDAPGKTCLDWTERRTHLGGPLGVQLASKLFEDKWIVRGNRERSIRVTTAGRRGFAQTLGISGAWS
jgi:DNA-binding transcriptional ArsR family regulator